MKVKEKEKTVMKNNLFEKTKIGNLEVKNHFIRSATYEGKANLDGSPTDKIYDLYEKLAQGEVGTIITSYSYITDYERPMKYQLGIYKDELIKDYQKITNMVHQYGSKIIMQIVHGSSSQQADFNSTKILGPSAIPHLNTNVVPKEMTIDDINHVVELFVEAGKRVKAANFDGVQIHCAHDYLLSQFISPIYNHRKDQYGGSVENRLRIVMEIYHGLRKELGDDYPIWIKINSSDEMENGLTETDFIEMSKILAHEGIDAIEVSGLKWQSHKPSERAYYKDVAMQLSKEIKIPIILTGGLREMNDILPIYEQSNVEFFGFARPFMARTNFIETLK